MPATPIATFTTPSRQGRPKVSRDDHRDVYSGAFEQRSRSFVADRSESIGRRQATSWPGTLDISSAGVARWTVAVSADHRPRSMRTSRRASRRITSMWRGSRSFASAWRRAKSDGSTVRRSTSRPRPSTPLSAPPPARRHRARDRPPARPESSRPGRGPAGSRGFLLTRRGGDRADQ